MLSFKLMFWKSNKHYKEPLLPINEETTFDLGHQKYVQRNNDMSGTIRMYHLHFLRADIKE